MSGWMFLIRVMLAGAVFVAGISGTEVWAARKTAKSRSKAYRVSSKAALLVEARQMKKLYDKSSTQRVLPASTTKVMTALVVLERLRLDQYVTVTRAAERALPSKIDVKAGERYKVRDLLYAILLNSANDASVVLATAVAGSEEKFVRLMNRRAAQLGARNTLFANSHGLPSGDTQYTTAHDMSLIFREALKKKFFSETIARRSAVIYSESGRKVTLKSHNKSLFLEWKQDVYGKTGYTNAAGACFVGYVVKAGKPYIIAVFDSESRWDDIKFLVERYVGVDL